MNCSPLAEPDDERAFVPDADQCVRFVVAHRDDRVMTLEIFERSAYGVGKITVVVERDQMGNHLGVGVRAQLNQVRRQARSRSSR